MELWMVIMVSGLVGSWTLGMMIWLFSFVAGIWLLSVAMVEDDGNTEFQAVKNEEDNNFELRHCVFFFFF